MGLFNFDVNFHRKAMIKLHLSKRYKMKRLVPPCFESGVSHYLNPV
jgi:hypothetical protein